MRIEGSCDKLANAMTADGADGSGEASSFAGLEVTFEEKEKEIFVRRADGVTRRLLDDHLWPADAGAEVHWSAVTPSFRFRTAIDPWSGELLPYEAVECAFVVSVGSLVLSLRSRRSRPPHPPPAIDPGALVHS